MLIVFFLCWTTSLPGGGTPCLPGYHSGHFELFTKQKGTLMATFDFNTSSLVKLTESLNQVNDINFQMEMSRLNQQAQRQMQKFSVETQERMVAEMQRRQEHQSKMDELAMLDQELKTYREGRDKADTDEVKALYERKITDTICKLQAFKF